MGTGDLSELALGWCTYGVGDQMSHYTVNAGVPKTLVQHLIRWVIVSRRVRRGHQRVLAEILDQEIAPELIPTEAGQKPQATEDLVGPYNLQDFTLFHVAAAWLRPRKIAFLAWHAWRDVERGGVAAGLPRGPPTWPMTCRRSSAWLEVFLRRSSPTSSSGRRCPTGRRSAPVGR